MNPERMKVLQMLAEGKITAEDAEKLLEKLAASASTGAAKDPAKENSVLADKRPRFLRVQVDRPGQEQVNMRVPLSFLRSGTGALALLPDFVTEKLAEKGIHIFGRSRLSSDELDETLQELDVDVEHSNGKKVRIYCE
jgi:hypothetical protein